MSGKKNKNQIRLSDSCQKLLEELDNALETEGASEEVWSSIKNFIRNDMASLPKEVKDKQNINEIFSRIFELRGNIVGLRESREEVRLKGLHETVEQKNMDIRTNYQSLKDAVESLRNEIKIIEDRKLIVNGTSWASPFLTKYYQAITYSGVLQDLNDKLSYIIESGREDQIEFNFIKQKYKLDLLSPVVDELNQMNRGFPDDLKEKLASILSIITSIYKCIQDEKLPHTKKTSHVIECHKKLRKEMKNLYEQTIERSVSK